MSNTHVTHLSAATISFVFGIAIAVLGTQMIAPIEFISPAYASVVPTAKAEYSQDRYYDRSTLEVGSIGVQTYSQLASR